MEGLIILINIYNKVKICNKCHTPKELAEFSNNKKFDDGKEPRCKVCVKEYKDTIKESTKRYKENWLIVNAEKAKQYDNNYYLKTKKRPKKEPVPKKLKVKEYNKTWNENNKEKRKEFTYKYLVENKDKVLKHNKDKYKNDINFRLKQLLRTRIYHALNNKKQHSIEYLLCNVEDYKLYLEQQFKPEMTWGNYGKIWEIDHIIPVSSFDLSLEENIFKAFNYKNTEPKFITTKIAESLGYKGYIGNREKSNKIF